MKINKCLNGHYFIGHCCPICNHIPVESIEYREGDCIACGQLCPSFAYCCNSPSPLDSDELKRYKEDTTD